jgi:hypothetical protein
MICRTCVEWPGIRPSWLRSLGDGDVRGVERHPLILVQEGKRSVVTNACPALFGDAQAPAVQGVEVILGGDAPGRVARTLLLEQR